MTNDFATGLFSWTLLRLFEFNAFSMYNHSVDVLVSGTPFWVLCQWEVHPFVGLKKPSSSVGPLETIFVSRWKEIDKASEGRLDWIDKEGASLCGRVWFFFKFPPATLTSVSVGSIHVSPYFTARVFGNKLTLNLIDQNKDVIIVCKKKIIDKSINR